MQDLARLDAETDDPNDIPADLATVVVINDWAPIRFGHRDRGGAVPRDAVRASS